MKLAIVAILVIVCGALVQGFPYSNTYCSGLNEVFSTCGSACPATCDNWNLGVPRCGSSCRVGCFCRSGFVRNSLGACVEPVQCSRRSVQVQQSVGYYPGNYYGRSFGYGYDNLLGSAVY